MYVYSFKVKSASGCNMYYSKSAQLGVQFLGLLE